MVFFRGCGVGAGRAAGRCISRAAVTMGLAGAMEVQKDPGEAGREKATRGYTSLTGGVVGPPFIFWNRK